MLNRLRHPGSALRTGLLLAACAALMVRALVPVGYMLGGDAPTGKLAVLLCPAHAELPAGGLPQSPDESHPGQAAEHGIESHDARVSFCAYSIAFLPLTAPLQSADGLLVDTRDTRFFELRQPVPDGNAPAVLTARGPPQRS